MIVLDRRSDRVRLPLSDNKTDRFRSSSAKSYSLDKHTENMCNCINMNSSFKSTVIYNLYYLITSVFMFWWIYLNEYCTGMHTVNSLILFKLRWMLRTRRSCPLYFTRRTRPSCIVHRWAIDTTVVSIASEKGDTTVVFRPQADNRHDRCVSSVSNHRHDRLS